MINICSSNFDLYDNGRVLTLAFFFFFQIYYIKHYFESLGGGKYHSVSCKELWSLLLLI